MKFAIVGGGWRAAFYLRAARALKDSLELCCLVEENKEQAEKVHRRFGITTVADIETALDFQPDFFVLCLPGHAIPGVMCRIWKYGTPILSETWMSDSPESMIELYEKTDKGSRIQISEQYKSQPMHSARLAVIQSGILGNVRQVQVSIGHDYHGIALIRKYLGKHFETCCIEGRKFRMKSIQGPGRNGWPQQKSWYHEEQELFSVNYGDKWALYDFTGEQYFSPIRCSRILIRGEQGEIEQEEVRYLTENYPEHLKFTLKREYSGWNNSLERPGTTAVSGNGQIYYRSPFGAAGLSDEELAVAASLWKMQDYLTTGAQGYSLGEELQDQYLTLLARESIQSEKPVYSQNMPWSQNKEDAYGTKN